MDGELANIMAKEFEDKIADTLITNGYFIYYRNFKTICKQQQKLERRLAIRADALGSEGKSSEITIRKCESRKCEINILLYKTIIECKNTILNNSYFKNKHGMNKLINQIERHYHYFPDFTHVLWFKEIDKESDFYFELKSKYPFLIIIDNIEDFKVEYTKPIEYYYINSQNTLWVMIAEKNDYDFSEILKRTRISQITIDTVRAFIDNEIEKK